MDVNLNDQQGSKKIIQIANCFLEC